MNRFDKIKIIKEVLGDPFAEGESYILYNRDCLEVMKTLPDGLFDLTVTSPPYNIGKDYETVLLVQEYVDWCQEWMAEIYRLTDLYGSFVLNVGYISIDDKGKAIPLPYLLWNLTEFFLVQEIVWNYGAGVASKKSLSPRNEKLLWYVQNPEQYTFNLDDIRDPDVLYPNQKKNGKLRCNAIGKNPSDVWQIAKVTSGKDRSSAERTPHPAQFPVDLIDRVIKGFSNYGDLVLDPFMGSGTTAASCMGLGRFTIGFEKNITYCEYAKDRLEALERKSRSVLFPLSIEQPKSRYGAESKQSELFLA